MIMAAVESQATRSTTCKVYFAFKYLKIQWLSRRGEQERERDREGAARRGVASGLLTALGRQHEELRAASRELLLLLVFCWQIDFDVFLLSLLCFHLRCPGQLVRGVRWPPFRCRGFIWSAHWMGKHFNLIAFLANALSNWISWEPSLLVNCCHTLWQTISDDN